MLLDGRRPLLGDGVPRGDVGEVLHEAPCDVAVLVAREGQPVAPAPGTRVVVPFGGAEHDSAALELASWLCAATGASLEPLGAGGQTAEGKHAGRMLADAALLVQQFAGVAPTTAVAEPGRAGIVAAASRADLLLIGCPSAGTMRASGRPDARSRKRPPPRSFSSGAASDPARSRSPRTPLNLRGRPRASAAAARAASAGRSAPPACTHHRRGPCSIPPSRRPPTDGPLP